jgi:hypothetical protein
MHAEFEDATIGERHVIRDALHDASALADRIEQKRTAGHLSVEVQSR